MHPILFFIFSLNFFGGYSEPTRVPGYIITLGRDTLPAEIDVEIKNNGDLDRWLMEDWVFATIGGNTMYYTPDVLSGYGFTFNYHKYHYVSSIIEWSETLNGKGTFIELEMEGKCRLYYHYEAKLAGGYTRASILEKNHVQYYFIPGKMQEVNDIKNGLTLKEYFSDCPVIVNRLKSRRYGRDPAELARDYNGVCGK